MAYEVEAVYSNGAFIPVTPIALAEGTRVRLHVTEQANDETPQKMMSREEMQEFLRMMASLPIESRDDGFSGVDHDKLLYGQP